ncbi:MAG: DUF6705 family protein [Psychroserpens sp.]|uniref:DUF6705 family protein n=1 Tax=Psychroserpens sp. TaxID=2020870 RepID=UPI003003711F
MKTTFYTLLLIVLFSCKSQQVYGQHDLNNLTPFVGTWENTNGNQIFRVTFYIDNLYIKGDYQLVEVDNGSETLLYRSNFDFDINGTTYNNGYAIFGGSDNGILMGAQIEDNTIGYENGERNKKDGILGFTIQPIPPLCLNCIITAEWKVKTRGGNLIDGDPLIFNIPTDIILTKVN